jgi:hypothetical protein
MSEDRMSHRIAVRGLVDMPDIEIRGTAYSGAYFSALNAIDPNNIAEESYRTPALVADLGRLVAAAQAQKEEIDARYRVWRERLILQVCTDEDTWQEAMFDKAPSKTAAEGWVRCQPEYLEWQDKIGKATEAYTTVYAAYEAAKLRSYAIEITYRNGVEASTSRAATRREQTTPGRYNDPGNIYTAGETKLPDEHLGAAESDVTTAARTPIPTIAPSGPPNWRS